MGLGISVCEGHFKLAKSFKDEKTQYWFRHVQMSFKGTMPGQLIRLAWRCFRSLARIIRYYQYRTFARAAYPIAGKRGPLLGYYERTKDFARLVDAQYIQIDPLEADLPGEALTFKVDTFVAVLPKARSVYDCGAVISPDQKLLADVSWHGDELFSAQKNHPLMRKLILPEIQTVSGRVAVIASVMCDNYYHWMFDIFPRFNLVSKSDVCSDYFLVPSTKRFQKDSIAILGISSNSLLDPTTLTHIEADELVVPSLPGPVYSMSPQPWACAYLRSVFMRRFEQRSPTRLVYITRSDAPNRHLINESEIQDEVRKNGFEVTALTNLSIVEQAQLFSEARVIIGPHGAGFTNAVFCKPGSILIEFMPKRRRVDCFERLAQIVGMKYHLIKGADDRHWNDNDLTDDYVVDKGSIVELLRQLI